MTRTTRLWARLREAYRALCLHLGARVLALYSVGAAVAGIEILGFITVWPLTVAGTVAAAGVFAVLRRRQARLQE